MTVKEKCTTCAQFKAGKCSGMDAKPLAKHIFIRIACGIRVCGGEAFAAHIYGSGKKTVCKWVECCGREYAAQQFDSIKDARGYIAARVDVKKNGY